MARKYDDEFRAKAVASARKDGVSAAAEELGCHPSLIYSWLKKGKRRGKMARKPSPARAPTPITHAMIYLREARNKFAEQRTSRNQGESELLCLLALSELEKL